MNIVKVAALAALIGCAGLAAPEKASAFAPLPPPSYCDGVPNNAVENCGFESATGTNTIDQNFNLTNSVTPNLSPWSLSNAQNVFGGVGTGFTGVDGSDGSGGGSPGQGALGNSNTGNYYMVFGNSCDNQNDLASCNLLSGSGPGRTQSVLGDPYAALSQTITTNPGDTYTVSFALANQLGSDPTNGGGCELSDCNIGDFVAFLNGTSEYENFFFGSGQTVQQGTTGSDAFGYTDITFSFTGTGSDTLEFDAFNNLGMFSLDDVVVTDQSPATPEPASIALVGMGLAAIGAARRRKK